MSILCLPLYKWLTALGLSTDIVGALLLWKFGLPEEISRHGRSYLVTEQEDPAGVAKAKHYDRWARIGLACLILGFVLQLAGNLAQ